MITSSKFFEKSFFTLDYGEEKVQVDEVSPWGLVPIRNSYGQGNTVSPKVAKKDPMAYRGYEISRNSSLKYIERKLKAKSHLNKSRELQPSQGNPKFYTIQQKLNQIQSKDEVRYTGSLQIISKLKRQKKKSHLFPQITINQYNDIKAKGSGILNTSNPIEQILERRKNRKKILQEFGRGSPKNINIGNRKESHSKSMEGKSGVLSGRYVCIAKSPQFSVNGLPTTKLLNQY